MAARTVAVVGHGPDLENDDGAARALRALGATVCTHHLWDDPAPLVNVAERLRVIIVETLGRPDFAANVTRQLRREEALAPLPIIAAVTANQVAHIDPTCGFDDFILHPYLPDELYARIRRVEWLRSEFSNEERIKIGPIVVDKQAQLVSCAGLAIKLTQRERALLVYLCERRGHAVSRRELLSRVWGDSYEGGHRTVDIHVRRLRKKLGDALPLRTLHGIGYRIDEPA